MSQTPRPAEPTLIRTWSTLGSGIGIDFTERVSGPPKRSIATARISFLAILCHFVVNGTRRNIGSLNSTKQNGKGEDRVISRDAATRSLGLDELDVRIFRALLSEKPSAPFSTQVGASLRQVARDLGVDDVTVRNRFKRFQERGFLSGWRLLPNPRLFGYGYSVLLVDIPPKSSKDDLVESLSHVPGVAVILEYYGDSLGVNLFHDSEQSLVRTIESVSRITNAEGVT